jgi:hypothetical protein
MTEPLGFRLLALFLADHADAVNGKVYVNGGFFNRLMFPMYPQAVPAMSLVAVCEVPFARYLSEHQFTVELVDQDGHPSSFKAQGSFRVGVSAEMEFGDPTVMPIAVPIYGLVLDRPGDYCFTFSIDGDELGRWSFRAMQVDLSQLRPPPPEAEAG